MKSIHTRILSLVMAAVLVLGLLPMGAMAISYDNTTDDYYKLISKTDYELAPGITESEIVLNNDAGTHRQVAHVVEVDIDNPYTKVTPSYKGMIPKPGNYGVQIMSQQAAWAEANGYGNVVAAMNLSLSWYDSSYYSDHPELVGEPLGYMILDGVQYTNSRGQTSGAQTCLVINFDEKDGVARPANVPKTEIRSTTSAITGWEEQVIPANFGFLVKNGKNQYSKDHSSGAASRSFVGIKANGDIVIVMNDGRQSPYSEGFNNYEMADFMISLGCVQAVNGDGGGSSAFLSQRPGEELELHCSPSDGAERATTHGVLVISTAPATGEFVRATISSDSDYYTPNSKVAFNALGTDLVGTVAEIPADAVWSLADDSFGTIDQNGVFISNGKIGAVTVQMVWEGKVVGSDTINVVLPDTISLGQNTITAPYGRDIELDVAAQYDSKNVTLKDGDLSIVLSNENMGTLNGNVFTATTDTTVTSGSITVTVSGTDLSVTVPVTFGKGSEVIFDFEGEDAAADWKQLNYNGVTGSISVANRENGQVRFGENSLAVTTDFSQIATHGGWVYFGMNTNLEDIIIPADAVSWGIWVYVPEEAVGGEIDFRPYRKNGNKYTRIDLVAFGNGYATTFDESGWHYVSVDISSYGELVIPGVANSVIANGQAKPFIEIYNPDTSNSGYGYNSNDYKSINGSFTYYLDDMTIDFSTAVDDREEPVFSGINAVYGDLESSVAVTGQTINYNKVIFSAKAAENTEKSNFTGLDMSSAKAFVDGVDMTDKLVVGPDGSMSLPELTLTDGVHTVKFAMADKFGNLASVIRQINVDAASGMETIKVVPHDASLDKILIGSLYYMDVVATDAATVQNVVVKIDLNNINEWEPQGLVVADGFEAVCDIDPIDEIATIQITKTGDVDVSGEMVLVSIPARTWVAKQTEWNPEYTPEHLWKETANWPLDLQFTVKYGVLTQNDGTVSSFSEEKFYVDTENYAGRYTATADYWTSKTCWHLHAAEAVEDVAATCTKGGYTGRTFCAGCNSVVEWGTILDATGHDYQLVDGVLKCVNSCGQLYNGELEGKTYIDGVVAEGWINDTYYYVDGVMVTGQYYMDGTMYTFGTDGVYQPNFMFTDFYETADGKLMYFVSNKPLTGYQSLMGKAYFFDAEGYGYEGEYVMAGETCLFENGQFASCSTANVINAGLAGNNATYAIYADGTFKLEGSGSTFSFTNHGTRPFIDYIGKIKTIQIGKDITRIATNFFAWTHVTKVEFSKVGKLEQLGTSAFLGCVYLREIELPATVTYMSTNAFGRCTNLKKVIVPASVTNISAKAFKDSANVTLYVLKDSYALNFAVTNKIPYAVYEPEIVKEIVEVDGVLYYVVDGVKTYGGLICLDGDYYYIRSNFQAVVNRTYWVTKTNDLLPEGNYTFGADGKMLNPPVVEPGEPDTPVVPDEPEVPSIPEAPGQIVNVNGVLYYRENGVNKYAGLIYLNGAIYYVRSNGQLAVNRTYWTTKHNDLMKAANYEFDAEGKMINPPIELPEAKPDAPVVPDEPEVPSIPEATGTIVNENGVLYYYENGARKYAGLIYLDGSYYYVRSNAQLVVGRTYWVTKNNDLLPAANYEFDAEGKLINN